MESMDRWILFTMILQLFQNNVLLFSPIFFFSNTFQSWMPFVHFPYLNKLLTFLLSFFLLIELIIKSILFAIFILFTLKVFFCVCFSLCCLSWLFVKFWAFQMTSEKNKILVIFIFFEKFFVFHAYFPLFHYFFCFLYSKFDLKLYAIFSPKKIKIFSFFFSYRMRKRKNFQLNQNDFLFSFFIIQLSSVFEILYFFNLSKKWFLHWIDIDLIAKQKQNPFISNLIHSKMGFSSLIIRFYWSKCGKKC